MEKFEESLNLAKLLDEATINQDVSKLSKLIEQIEKDVEKTDIFNRAALYYSLATATSKSICFKFIFFQTKKRKSNFRFAFFICSGKDRRNLHEYGYAIPCTARSRRCKQERQNALLVCARCKASPVIRTKS